MSFREATSVLVDPLSITIADREFSRISMKTNNFAVGMVPDVGIPDSGRAGLTLRASSWMIR